MRLLACYPRNDYLRVCLLDCRDIHLRIGYLQGGVRLLACYLRNDYFRVCLHLDYQKRRSLRIDSVYWNVHQIHLVFHRIHQSDHRQIRLVFHRIHQSDHRQNHLVFHQIHLIVRRHQIRRRFVCDQMSHVQIVPL